ncbi:glycosyltransferase family 4 protein [Vallicoccus soli]|uniref:Glycosyltransferase n=1 Tax=Vallicoccus soli TaxID=2339232 RepID=A0A3A3YN15_9ACTN|nr:glycosyltransferase family 4 protein [Vallicoccus soli]RJK92779.1 glycosyltransferase [Vallicoccus soli]
MRVVLWTDATGVGGAEISVANLVGAAPAGLDLVVAGVHRGTVERLAGGRAEPVVLGAGPAATAAGLRRLGPDVVHVNRYVPWSSATAVAAALALPAARVVTVDQLPLRTTAAHELWRTRALTLRADAAVAVGRVSARRIEDFYALGRGSVRSVPNGVPPVDVPVRPADADLVVGSLGRLDPMKGFDVALHALADVPGVRLVVHGSGGAGSDLAALAGRLGVADRVRWAPWTDDREEALGGLDAFVLPSRTEGFSLSLVEAMSAGLPCIASSVGGAEEALDGGRAGLLVRPDDAAGLAGALTALRDDRGLRDRLGAAARERARSLYTAQAMARAYADLWAEVVDRPRAPRLRPPRPRA